MRINKLFSNYGICSRKETNKFIEDNRVIINGKFATKGQWVEESDNILLDNKPLKKREKIYIALNKPTGITTTLARDVKDNILDFMNYKEYIFPVGRLDKESQGLIIMTNDGDLANKILKSENNHEKEYIVTVDKPFNDEFIEKMSKGVYILNTKTKPCKVTRINEDTFNIILTQGLNKQIRRMSKALGYKVIYLKRIRIMNINIDGILKGEFRNLTEEEVEELKNYK
ncbi:23S rRNA pseudouridine2604 synthase [Clostridium moniliforme]|uniref:Pseudouridine synthase n=1 Tax=Clostridium moniliforme TaxID=39489 RepID=A0ABS4F031_9CLOT|nr:pseudouridine synthase [Clostridium moniliforme]MBP1889605.1 23S rRNA pseudouridine2604 synthase [Clostridium moniliforme]